MVHSAKEKSVARISEELDGDTMNKRPKRTIFKKKLVRILQMREGTGGFCPVAYIVTLRLHNRRQVHVI